MSLFTAIEDKLRSAEPEIDAFLAFLKIIEDATGIGGAAAATGLAAIAAAYKALAERSAGTLTHEDYLNQLAQAQQDLAGDRAGEDADLAARFPVPPTGNT